MDFSLSEAQTEIAGLARKILAERDSAAQRQWADLAAAGVLAAGLPRVARRRGPWLPRAVLGARGDRPGRVARSPTFRRSCSARARSPRSAPRTSSAGGPLPAGSGSVVLTAALAEEDSDDPGGAVDARRARAGDGWRLSGVKTAVPAAAAGRSPARPGDGDRRAGGRAGRRAGEVLVFLVEPSDRGVTASRRRN